MDRSRDGTRRCDRCGELKAVSDFGSRNKNGARRQDNYCRTCRAQYQREHYEKHKELYIERSAQRTKRLVARRAKYMIELFRSRPCVDCGETDPLVLEFDHLADKEFNVGAGMRERSWQALVDEIAKCDIVCANCHRVRTALRAGSVRVAIAERHGIAQSTAAEPGISPS